MYYSMYIYTHTVGYCEQPGEAETGSTESLTSVAVRSAVISSRSSTNVRCARPKPARHTHTLLGEVVLLARSR